MTDTNHKRVFIIHGWGGNPDEGWFPWLKQELENRGITVNIPPMPESEHPVISAWLTELKNVIGQADENTILVGHSIGCNALLRYLETLENKVGGLILVAPWLELDDVTIAEEGPESVAIAKPWVETPIDFKKVRNSVDHIVAIFSDNDPFVPMNNADLFREKLGANIVVEQNRGHFSGSDGLTELPSALLAISEIMN